MSADQLADLAVAAVFGALSISMTYRPRYGEPVVVQAVQVRPPPALDGLGGGRVAHDGLIAQIRAADLARPPAEGDQAIIDQRRYRVRSARWADTAAGLGNRGGALLIYRPKSLADGRCTSAECYGARALEAPRRVRASLMMNSPPKAAGPGSLRDRERKCTDPRAMARRLIGSITRGEGLSFDADPGVCRGRARAFPQCASQAVDVGGRKAMRITAGDIRRKIAGNVRRAFPSGGGRTLAKLVRSRISGKGADIEGTVFSRAAYGRGARRPSGPVDLVQLYAQGATIKSARGGYLAIPTENAPLKSARGPRGQRMTPREMIEAGQKLAFIPAGTGRLVAILERGGTSVVTHVLVRQVSLRKRYDIQSVVDRYAAQFPEIVAREINAAADASAVLRRYGG